MKRTLFVVISLAMLLTGCKLGTRSEVEISPSTLTAAEQAKLVLEELNEICPDSYCEGDFEYEFKAIACADAVCTLTMSAKKHDAKKKQDVTLELKGLKATDLVMNEEGIDYVSDAFYDAFDDAIFAWEDARLSSR